MSSTANYSYVPRVGSANVGVADGNRVVPIFASAVIKAADSAPAVAAAPGVQAVPARFGGTRIDNIDIQGQGATLAATVRLWDFDTVAGIYTQIREVGLDAVTPTGSVPPAFKALSSINDTDFLPLELAVGHELRASTSVTQTGALLSNASAVAVSQSIGANANAVINGVTAVAADPVAVSAAATQGAAAFLTLTSSPYVPTAPAPVTLTSTGNISGVPFIITGKDSQGATITETINGPNNNTVSTNAVFTTVISVFASAAVATATSAGKAAVAALPVPARVNISSTVSLTAINFTIAGVTAAGATDTETFVGPPAGTMVQGAKLWRTVGRVTASAAANPVLIGTGPMPFGFRVTARGGDY